MPSVGLHHLTTSPYFVVQLFEGLYVDDTGQPLAENFDTVPTALLSMFVLLSTE